jgi:hypothetical protein
MPLGGARQHAGGSPTAFLSISGSGGDAYRGVVITPTLTMGETTVEIRGHQDCTTDNTSQPVRRCSDISPATAQSATIRFSYLASEANGNGEGSVNVFRWTGSGWLAAGGAPSHSSGADPRWVEVPDVSAYSPFVLDDQTPPFACKALGPAAAQALSRYRRFWLSRCCC